LISIRNIVLPDEIQKQGLQEGSDAIHFMDIKGLAKQKKIKMSPSM